MANYSKIKDHEAEVLALKAEGWTNQAIADHFGFSGKKAVKEFFVRKSRREREGPKVTIPKQRGRPRNTPLTTEEEKDRELERLRMENELLRDFLQLAGRR